MPRLVFLLLLVLAVASPANAARPRTFTPASGEEVLERLPRGYAQLEPAAADASGAVAAQRLLEAAAATGDSRLAARAEALLARLPADSPDVLRLRAFAAQHRHDFPAALRLLDRLLRLQPRDAGAHLARAQVQLVQGHLDLARADCAALALGIDAADGMLCAASLALRQGRFPAAAMLAERWLTSVPPSDPRRGYALLLRADAASRARSPDADTWYRHALALRADDVRSLAAYARHLRASGRPAQALRLLANAPRTDGLELQRALAAKAARAPEASALAEAQASRYRLARALGNTPELRDEAEFELSLRGDPAAALALAQRNFTTQRDAEDVDLLRRAAAAARQPEVGARIDAWSRKQGLLAGAPK
jgi:Tfp pilus assembly protein PilF